MRQQYQGRFVLLAAILFSGICASTAPAQEAVKLRYGYQKGGKHSYRVTVVADLPNEEITKTGVLLYDVLSSTGDQFTLKCTGRLQSSAKAKAGAATSRGIPRGPRGPRGPRVPAGPPRHFGPWAEPAREQETTFDRQGKIVRQGDDPSLPFLLGRQAELVIEQFPDEAKPTWSIERELGVVERNHSSGPSFGPFGRGAGSETNRGAKERIDYAVIGQDQDSIRISKKYSLKTAPEEGVTRIDMSGEGELVFDKKQGIITSHKMKYQVRINEKNVAVTVPYSLEYRLATEQEVAEQQKKESEEEKKHEERIAKIKADQAAREKGDKAAGAAAPAMRTWRAAAGAFTVRATFVELESDNVTLKKADGRIIRVPLEKLSKVDQEYAKRHAKAGKGKSEDPFQ